MFKYTKHTLKKMEELFKSELKYTIRYERGNFQSGYCIVENRKIAVINKFFDVEARINCLLEILSSIDVETTGWDEKTVAFYGKLVKVMEASDAEKEDSESEEVVVTEEEVSG